jgi:hypothetical protein
LPLINTLRIPDKGHNPFETMRSQGIDDEEGKEEMKGSMDTVPNPPSFYYNDIEKWNGKFAKHITERDEFKKYF